MLECDRKDLVRPESSIVAVLAIDDIVQIAARRMPKAAIEGIARLVRIGCEFLGFGVLCFTQPIRQQAERVVPERVDLDRLAAARGHHPIADFRIHPGERVTLRTLGEEPVMRVDLDAETGAIEMMPYDVLQDRQKELQGRLVLAMLDIAVQRMK